MACESFGSQVSSEKVSPAKPRPPRPKTERPPVSKRREFFRTFRRIWQLTKAWADDFGRNPPSEKEFLEAAETRLGELSGFPYPEAAGRGILIIKGESRDVSFRAIPDYIVNGLTWKKAAGMGWDERETAGYCRKLRGLRSLLMREFANESYLRLLEGARELFPELDEYLPHASPKDWERRGEHIKMIFEVMLHGLGQKAESDEQFSRATSMFLDMLLRETDVYSLREWVVDGKG